MSTGLFPKRTLFMCHSGLHPLPDVQRLDGGRLPRHQDQSEDGGDDQPPGSLLDRLLAQHLPVGQPGDGVQQC